VTTREFLAIEKRLLPSFPGFTVKGRLMFIHPLGDTLRGFHLEPSAFSKKDFYVNVFFLPLYVLTEHLHFTFGHRIGRDKRWSADRSDLETALGVEMQKEVRFLAGLKTAKDVAKALGPLTKPNEAGYVNPHCYEALAYAHVRAGEIAVAANVIDALLKSINPTVAWESDVASRVRMIRDRLLEKPEKACELLTTWEAKTIRNLGLDAFSSDRRVG